MPDIFDTMSAEFATASEKIRQALISELVKVFGRYDKEQLLEYISSANFTDHIINDLGMGNKIEGFLEQYDRIARDLVAQKIGMVSVETVERLKNIDALYFMNHVRDVGTELTKQMTLATFGGVTEKNIQDTLLNATKNLSESQVGSLVNTSLRTFDRAVYADMVSDFPDDAIFEYQGGGLIETSRDFCREWFGRQITYGELKGLRNDFGEPALIAAGGFNCRHDWKFVGTPE